MKGITDLSCHNKYIYYIISHKEEKTMVNITQLQNHVLGPSEDVPYASILERAFPPAAFREPFVSVKLLMQDEGYMNARCGAERMKQIDSVLPRLLANSACILREAEPNVVPNGYGIYLISLPVPRSQFMNQIKTVISVMNNLAQHLGIVYTGFLETNVSGKMNQYDENVSKRMFVLPNNLKAKVCVRNEGWGSSIGKIEPINPEYRLFRIMWKSPAMEGFVDEILEMIAYQVSAFVI